MFVSPQDALLSNATAKERTTVAKSACYAAVGLQKWELLSNYSEHLDESDNDKPFFQALNCIYKNKFDEAQSFLKTARQKISEYFPSMLGEAGTYSRSYDYIVKFQVRGASSSSNGMQMCLVAVAVGNGGSHHLQAVE